MNLKLIAPTVNRLYDPSLDTSISPREYGIVEYIAIGLGLSVAAPCVTYLLLKLATVAGGIDIPPIIIPLVPTIVGMLFLLLVFGIVIYSLHRRSANQEKILEIGRLAAEADKTRAEAVRFEAEAKYIKAQAEAHPTVIATETVAIPQIGQARVTVHNEDKDAAYVEKVIEPPKLWTWKDREYKRDDLREFLKRSLPQPDDNPKSRKVRHSRRSWIEQQEGETEEQMIARQTLPSGDRIASQDKHNWYCEPFEYYGFLRGRGGETNSPGNWLTTDFDEICKIMKL